MAKQPALLGYTALLGDTVPKPSKWEQTKQALWESNLNTPVRAFYNLMNTPEYVLAGGGTPEERDAAVANSFDAAGGMMIGGSVVPKPSNSLTMGIKAFHGSPHSFDKFSMDKIGTGEGAQAYGHGLYFAENEGIARSYRDALSPAVIDGKPVDYNAGNDLAASWYTAFKDRAKAADYLQRQIDNPPKSISNFRSSEEKAAMQDAIALLRSDAPISETKPSGSMYEVNIDADPNAFLDWDKPLSEQSETVRKALHDNWLAHPDAHAKQTGAKIYQKTADGMGAIDWPDNATADVRAQYRKSASERAAEKLKEAGIPGIKYLDAGSRGAGDGTRNYVVFDDKLISIVRKYGIAGASAMLGYNIMQGTNNAQADTLIRADKASKKNGGGGW